MLKENILSKSLTSKALDEDELILLRDTSVTDLADAADLPSPTAANLNQAYFVKGVHYRCEEVSAGVFEWITYDTSGQSLNYQDASNKPSLNGITINGALTSADYGLASDSTQRTAAATLEKTDKIPINDDKYTTFDGLGNAIAKDYSTQREFSTDYPFLYFQSDLSMLLTNTASTTNLVLTNDTSNSVTWSFTPTQSGIIKSTDEINVQFSTSGLVNATYNAVIELYLNSTLIASETTTFGNSWSISPQLHINLLTNSVGDVYYLTSDSIKIKLTLNKVGGSGSATIYIYNDSTHSSFLNIRKYIGQSEYTTETLNDGTFTLYSPIKNSLRFINYTYAGPLAITLSHYISTYKGIEINGSEHQVIIYNNSGAQRSIYISSSQTGLPAAISQNIDNGKYLCFKYKLININSISTIYITEIQSNIISG